jgi:hypothetical protein
MEDVYIAAVNKGVRCIDPGPYKNSKSHYWFKCKNIKHKKYQNTLTQMLNPRNGNGCKYCYYERAGAYKKLKTSDVISYINTNDARYRFDGDKTWKFEGVGKPLPLKCKHHGSFTMSLDSLKAGSSCPTCALQSRAKNKSRLFEDINKELSQFGYSLIRVVRTKKESYSITMVEYVCDSGHKITQALCSLSAGRRCRLCVKNGISNAELGFFADIKEKFPKHKVVNGYKADFLKRQHIDVAIPEEKLAFEFQGKHCHGDPKKAKNEYERTLKSSSQIRDRKKARVLIENGWRLVKIHSVHYLKDFQKAGVLANIKEIIKLPQGTGPRVISSKKNWYK